MQGRNERKVILAYSSPLRSDMRPSSPRRILNLDMLNMQVYHVPWADSWALGSNVHIAVRTFGSCSYRLSICCWSCASFINWPDRCGCNWAAEATRFSFDTS